MALLLLIMKPSKNLLSKNNSRGLEQTIPRHHIFTRSQKYISRVIREGQSNKFNKLSYFKNFSIRWLPPSTIASSGYDQLSQGD